MSETDRLQTFAPREVRYIKLGPGGAWLDRCLEEGSLELGYAEIPHAMALAAQWAEAVDVYTGRGRTPGKAKSFVREVRDFYELGKDCLWITVGRGRLWWAFAEPAVQEVDGHGRGARIRRVRGKWSSESLTGETLQLSRLSTRLTKVAAYQQTICNVSERDYLLRRIRGDEGPSVRHARTAVSDLRSAAGALIEQLDWRDFELLVDLIFAGSGWRRVSAVGGSDQADSDLVLEQAVTGERAFLQVKSKANASVLRDYVDRFKASGLDRMFFICHSPAGQLSTDDPRVRLWLGDELSRQAVKAGLVDWLIEKVR